MVESVLKSLKGLLLHPNDEWRDIHKSYQGSILYILRYYFLFFFVVIPLAISLRLFLDAVFTKSIFSLKDIFLRAWVITWILFAGYIFILYLLSIVIEEAGEFIGGSNAYSIGSKVAYFSALPFLAFCVLAPIPKIGFIFPIVGIFYQIFLIFNGGSQLLSLQGPKKILWFLTVLVAFMLLLFLIMLLASLLSIIYQLF